MFSVKRNLSGGDKLPGRAGCVCVATRLDHYVVKGGIRQQKLTFAAPPITLIASPCTRAHKQDYRFTLQAAIRARAQKAKIYGG